MSPLLWLAASMASISSAAAEQQAAIEQQRAATEAETWELSFWREPRR